VRDVLEKCLRRAQELGASSVAVPALATGYGGLEIPDFGRALQPLLSEDWTPIQDLLVVIRRADHAAELSSLLAVHAHGSQAPWRI
jgi:O-acetyl-ADP-ribose deacetylase (regulator of RNase III)